MKIDAHTHGFPERLALAVRLRLEQGGPLSGGPLVPDLAAQLQAAAFDGAWVLPYAHRDGVAGSVNEWSAQEVTSHKGLVAGATFHPADDDIEQLTRRAFDELALRVVKLHCSVGDFLADDERLSPLWQAVAERAIPVVVHAGREAPGDTSTSELDALARVLDRYPTARIVVAHTGQPNCARTLELMEAYPGLCADLTPVWEQRVAVDGAALRRFRGRFLFGSDAPNSPIPLAAQEAWVASLCDGDARLFAEVMGENATRLLASE